MNISVIKDNVKHLFKSYQTWMKGAQFDPSPNKIADCLAATMDNNTNLCDFVASLFWHQVFEKLIDYKDTWHPANVLLLFSDFLVSFWEIKQTLCTVTEHIKLSNIFYIKNILLWCIVSLWIVQIPVLQNKSLSVWWHKPVNSIYFVVNGLLPLNWRLDGMEHLDIHWCNLLSLLFSLINISSKAIYFFVKKTSTQTFVCDMIECIIDNMV